MRKLYAANLIRLWKNKIFRGSLILMAVLGAYIPVTDYINMRQDNSVIPLESSFFSYIIFLPIILSVFCSMFVGTEYSDGTIRNKITVGHKRQDIYLANLFICMTAGVLLNMVFSVCYLGVGIPLLGFFEIPLRGIGVFFLASLVLYVTFAAMFTCAAMSNANKAAGAVLCVLSVFLLIAVGTYIESRLSEPEIYNGYVITEDGVEIGDERKNPAYLDGTKRKVYEFLHDFLPGDQIIQCSSMEAEHPFRLPVYSAIIFAGTTAAGIVIFKRKDIK